MELLIKPALFFPYIDTVKVLKNKNLPQGTILVEGTNNRYIMVERTGDILVILEGKKPSQDEIIQAEAMLNSFASIIEARPNKEDALHDFKNIIARIRAFDTKFGGMLEDILNRTSMWFRDEGITHDRIHTALTLEPYGSPKRIGRTEGVREYAERHNYTQEMEELLNWRPL